MRFRTNKSCGSGHKLSSSLAVGFHKPESQLKASSSSSRRRWRARKVDTRLPLAHRYRLQKKRGRNVRFEDAPEQLHQQRPRNRRRLIDEEATDKNNGRQAEQAFQPSSSDVQVQRTHVVTPDPSIAERSEDDQSAASSGGSSVVACSPMMNRQHNAAVDSVVERLTDCHIRKPSKNKIPINSKLADAVEEIQEEDDDDEFVEHTAEENSQQVAAPQRGFLDKTVGVFVQETIMADSGRGKDIEEKGGEQAKTDSSEAERQATAEDLVLRMTMASTELGSAKYNIAKKATKTSTAGEIETDNEETTGKGHSDVENSVQIRLEEKAGGTATKDTSKSDQECSVMEHVGLEDNKGDDDSVLEKSKEDDDSVQFLMVKMSGKVAVQEDGSMVASEDEEDSVPVVEMKRSEDAQVHEEAKMATAEESSVEVKKPAADIIELLSTTDEETAPDSDTEMASVGQAPSPQVATGAAKGRRQVPAVVSVQQVLVTDSSDASEADDRTDYVFPNADTAVGRCERIAKDISLAIPRATGKRKQPHFSSEEYSELWRSAIEFVGGYDIKAIEESNEFRNANKHVSLSDSDEQEKAQYGRILPKAMDVSVLSVETLCTTQSFDVDLTAYCSRPSLSLSENLP
jgi:hypothetical protein